jgi:hypothetical protein
MNSEEDGSEQSELDKVTKQIEENIKELVDEKS